MSDQFGDRMKEYEAVSDIKLTRRVPIILRLDGNSFSKFTKQKGFEKPFDARFYNAMCAATEAVLKYCSGAQVGYTQSDEITILLRNDQTVDTQAFLANRLEKLCSLIASTASVHFNKALLAYALDKHRSGGDMCGSYDNPIVDSTTAIFDCRVFLVPKEEVNNAFLWRQQDAFKNATQGVAYWGLAEKYGKKTAQKMLHGKSNSQQQELIFQELGFNMNDYPTKYKRGVCIVRKTVETPIEEMIGAERAEELKKTGEIVQRKAWTVDEEIPRFDQDTNYLNQFAGFKDETVYTPRYIGVHVTHCCVDHGCKYAEEDCPVVSGQYKQKYRSPWWCEDCSDE